MVEAGILDGDIVVIRRQDSANTGDIIVALIDDEEATLKRFRRRGSSIALEAANPAYETRVLGPDRVQDSGQARQPGSPLLRSARDVASSGGSRVRRAGRCSGASVAAGCAGARSRRSELAARSRAVRGRRALPRPADPSDDAVLRRSAA